MDGPVRRVIDLGQKMVLIAVTALGAAGLLASTTGSAATAAVNVLTLNFAGAAATVVGHLMMNFLAVPIFLGCMALLVPGLLIAFVLPMIRFAIWIAGVAGYFITVCEAVIALPMWMIALLGTQGDGLHGRGLDGVALLANLIFRPVLMLFGLMLGYVIFAAMSWLVMQGFGIAAGFVLAGGWLVANLLGVVVLLCLFVLTEVTLALLSFRMISLVPHHAVQLMAIKPANRVDMDRFAQDLSRRNGGHHEKAHSGANALMTRANEARSLPGKQAASPSPTGAHGADSTLSAAAEVTPPVPEPQEA